MKKKILGLMFVTALFFSALINVGAYTWTRDVKFVNIPAWGNELTNYTKPNTKTTKTQTASFYCTKRTANLSNSARVVNSNGALRSNWVAITENTLKKVTETNAEPNYYYYARVKSHTLEWSGNNDVTLDFSADDAYK